MAAALPALSFVLSLFLLLCSCYSKAYGDDEGFEAVEFSTLRTANVCSEWKAPSRNSVKLVHRFGPCSPSSDGGPDNEQIFAQDSLRVAYIQNQVRISNAKANMTMDPIQTSLEVTLPAKDGMYIGNSVYVVTIGIGTPKREQTVVLDTGSNLCWLQCEPCRSCYQQAEPRFSSTASHTYRDVSCNDEACIALRAYGIQNGCTGNVCTYQTHYMDSSTSSGLLAKERLELSASQTSRPVVLPNFVFGCGKSNNGHFGRVAGMFGFGRGVHSLVTQASVTLGSAFSYCLPSMRDVPGYLVIGRRTAPSPMYTPMLTNGREDIGYYFLDLVGITVGRQRLQLSASVFRNAGTMIDSGTLISRLPPAAYTMLRDAFRREMSHYQLARPDAAFDTCYTIRGSDVTYPSMTLHFNGADLPLKKPHILYYEGGTRYCLAFAAADRAPSIIGVRQQLGIEVIYDIQGRRIGFSPGTNCR